MTNDNRGRTEQSKLKTNEHQQDSYLALSLSLSHTHTHTHTYTHTHTRSAIMMYPPFVKHGQNLKTSTPAGGSILPNLHKLAGQYLLSNYDPHINYFVWNEHWFVSWTIWGLIYVLCAPILINWLQKGSFWSLFINKGKHLSPLSWGFFPWLLYFFSL